MNKKLLTICCVIVATVLTLGIVASFLPYVKEEANKPSESLVTKDEVVPAIPDINEAVSTTADEDKVTNEEPSTIEEDHRAELPSPEVNESSSEQEIKDKEDSNISIVESVETVTDKNDLPEQVSSEEGKKNPSKVIESITEKDEIRQSEGYNTPKYVDPSNASENPFDSDNSYEITDVPVDELIDEGCDRPGEGIHF